MARAGSNSTVALGRREIHVRGGHARRRRKLVLDAAGARRARRACQGQIHAFGCFGAHPLIDAGAPQEVADSYWLTTVTDRHAEAPAASKAFTVIMLVPSSRGMAAAVHEVVPVAVPELPVEFVQVTEVTLAVAVPLMVMLGSDVATIVIEGEVIVSDGGPEGVGVVGVVGVVGAVGMIGVIGRLGMIGVMGTAGREGGVTVETCCVTVIELEAVLPVLSVTCTVITLDPGLSGTEPIDQLADPAAVPVAP